ncbi:YceI family protein [Ancylobacter sp. WKF20]|uniref:YceI family protein n=1 Tax=Ancylobacter sp. WKF20 TaxID=3039801 RepID=UPI0024341198|nr:YceI family protein [Ancylobacter sp. WKF20]WGD28726.1 YceI family protein [Ancylobacter sp. WKF20]
MRRWFLAALAAATLGALSPAQAQDAAQRPGQPDVARISGGTYEVDANHTQVIWSVDHLGFTPLSGMFGRMSGTLLLDPKAPDMARLAITIPMEGLVVTSPRFAEHLASAEFFDAAKFPTATFTSTRVTVRGTQATIEGDLTLHGVTRPVTLEARFIGAGYNPQHKAENVGFTATANVKRSDFGLGEAVPMVSDEVTLTIVGAFKKRPS